MPALTQLMPSIHVLCMPSPVQPHSELPVYKKCPCLAPTLYAHHAWVHDHMHITLHAHSYTVHAIPFIPYNGSECWNDHQLPPLLQRIRGPFTFISFLHYLMLVGC